MAMRKVISFLSMLAVFAAGSLAAGDESTGEGNATKHAASPIATRSVEDLAANVRASLVSISVMGRDGGQVGLGTGFLVSPDGLVATNLHVIGEGHRFTAELADGTDLDVTAVHASDHRFDLAILQIDSQGKKLTPLPLGDSSSVRQGADVVIMGNPMGLKHSVVAGVISAKRDINGQSMLQLAMPIEPGNSGGPVLDRQGRVLGLVNMKSVINENLGFAVEVDKLKLLLDKPNPIPIARWMTIGGIDEKRWKPLMGAHWRQRAGRILVDGPGAGFGGRSLCLYQLPAPELPFEVAVQVKLDDESGAAGLIFHSDGADRHYGFYPSNGNLRFTCFNGPTVYEWQVLQDRPSEHYRPGDWNRLSIRVEKDRVRCFVNDELVVESKDTTFASGKVGLAKFRNTSAEFRHFQVAKEIVRQSQEDTVSTVTAEIGKFEDRRMVTGDQLAAWASNSDSAVLAIRQQARAMELRAESLRRLARDVHAASVVQALTEVIRDRDTGFDLLHAGLLIAKLDEEDIDVEGYLQQVDRMADEIKESLTPNADAVARLEKLNDYLFQQNGYHGSRFEYYHKANSYLNRVIDDRAGLPITLSVLYMELGRRLDLKIEGVGLPSHFVVRHVPPEGDPQLIDVFDRGRKMTRQEAEQIVKDNGGPELRDEHLRAQNPREIVRRMLANLWGNAQRGRDSEALLRYAEASMAIDPGSVEARLNRAILRGESGRTTEAIADLDWLLEHAPPALEIDRVRELRDRYQHR